MQVINEPIWHLGKNSVEKTKKLKKKESAMPQYLNSNPILEKFFHFNQN